MKTIHIVNYENPYTGEYVNYIFDNGVDAMAYYEYRRKEIYKRYGDGTTLIILSIFAMLQPSIKNEQGEK